MSGSRPSILISHLYDAAVQTAAEIKQRQDALGVKPATARPDEYYEKQWAREHAFPHQSLDFGNVNGQAFEAATPVFNAQIDEQVARDVARARNTPFPDVSSDQTIAAIMKKATPSQLPLGLGKLFGETAKNESNKQSAANELAEYATQMRRTLRTLKVAMDGTEPDERHGYKTHPLAIVYADAEPKSKEGWSEIGDNTLKALQPEFVDSLVVDKATDQSWGVSMLRWGDNDYGQAESPSYSLRQRLAYSRRQVQYPSFTEAQGAFNQILGAKDINTINVALREPVSEYNTAVSVRHTHEGNFLGGAFTNDATAHPNRAVRADAAARLTTV